MLPTMWIDGECADFGIVSSNESRGYPSHRGFRWAAMSERGRNLVISARVKFLVCLRSMSKKRKRQHDEEGERESNEQMPEEAGSVSSELGGVTETASRMLDDAALRNVQKKIFHATKEMSRAFKKAKDFEVRKIIKRIKAAKYRNAPSECSNR